MDDSLPKYERAHDMDSWLKDPRIAKRGFSHRWRSKVAAGNGEDAFITLIDQHIRSDSDVLDLGCGHGEFTLLLATRCRNIVGIERNLEYLDLARELTAELSITNANFFQVNLAGPDEDIQGSSGIPLPDDSIDLFINRRGPILRRYLDEAIRVARHGAVILGLHPAGNTPVPPWRDELPQPYHNAFLALSFDEVAAWVTDPLQTVGIPDYRLWWIDVPEFLRSPHELYVRLGGSDHPGAPAYPDIEPQLARIFDQHRTPHGVIVRHQRLLWKAAIPKGRLGV